MSDTLLAVIGVILILFIAFKIFKKVIKVLVFLALIVIGLILYHSMSDGSLSFDLINSIFLTHRMQ